MAESPWDIYSQRIDAKGGSMRGAAKHREIEFLRYKARDSLSHHVAIVDGSEQEVFIINSDNYNQKTIISMPGDDIRNGCYVQWMDTWWIVTERDFNTELYTKCKMLQCNYLLRWVNAKKEIIERHAIVIDGTKYLTGETVSSYNDNGMALGDSRAQLTLPRDSETLQLNRKNRFLVDDYESGNVLAYRLTKPFKVGSVYENNGPLNFMIDEVNLEKDDNTELHIANYYSYFPDGRFERDDSYKGDNGAGAGKESWL